MRHYLLYFAAPLVLALTVCNDAAAGAKEIMHGSLAVQAANAIWLKWELTPGFLALGAKDFRISGTLTASGGSGNDVEVLVLKETEFLNWQNGHAAHALYSSGRVTAADVDAAMPEAGTYYIVLDNRFSAMTPKTVEGTLTVRWTDPPRVDATGAALLAVAIISAGVAVALIAVLIGRRRRGVATKEAPR